MATRRRSASNTITGTISDLQRRVQYLQNAPKPKRLANQVVTRNTIQPRAVGGDQIALNAITNDQIAADAIERENIAPAAVDTLQLNNGAVTNAKIGPFAVNNAKLSDAAVELRNMTPNSVANPSLQNGSVNFRTVAVDAIGKQNMQNNSVGTNEIEGNAVTNNELANNSVGQSNMQINSVGFSQMQGGSVGTSTLQNGSVSRAKIGSGQVGSAQIANGAITADKIANGAIRADKIANNAVVSTKIGDATRRIIVSSGLSVGFGISKSGSNISVNTTALGQQYAAAAHRHGFFDRYGVVGQTTAFTFTGFPVSSSIKRKKDVQDYELKNPKNLLNLNFKKFKYKRPDSNYHTQANREWMHGYIIEELMDLGFDEVIHYDKDGNPEKLDYSLFSALVLELVKVQQQEIDCLREKVEKLEKNDIPI